jgi:carbon storage regulator
MLVLTRRLNETIVINGNITITVVAVQGNKVRLGITAPPSVPVDRQEVHKRLAEFTVDLGKATGGIEPTVVLNGIGGVRPSPQR